MNTSGSKEAEAEGAAVDVEEKGKDEDEDVSKGLGIGTLSRALSSSSNEASSPVSGAKLTLFLPCVEVEVDTVQEGRVLDKSVPGDVVVVVVGTL